MLAIIDQMEMDFRDAYPINHDKQHYCMRQALGHEPFGALKVITSNDICQPHEKIKKNLTIKTIISIIS